MAHQKPVTGIVEKIAKECADAGANTWTITRVIKELSAENQSNKNALKAKALALLKKIDPKTANVFARFQKMNVRTSKQTIEGFDRGNIIRSLLKETNVNRGIAETIGKEVENKIKDLNIAYINTALIREMVNAKLLEYGHEKIRNQYARVGLPVFEVKKRIHYSRSLANSILTEYHLLNVIPHDLGDLHLQSDIFIAGIEHFSTHPLSSIVCPVPSESLESFFVQFAHSLCTHHNTFAFPPNIYGINFSLSKHINKRNLNRAVALVHQMLSCVPAQHIHATLCLNTFIPDELENYDVDREQSNTLLNCFLEKKQFLGPAFDICLAVDSQYKLKLITGKNLRNLTIVNSNSQHNIPLNGSAGRRSFMGVFGINLEKIALEAENEKAFFDRVSELSKGVFVLGKEKQIALEKNKQAVSTIDGHEQQDNTAALYGLVKASRIITHSEAKKDLVDFCEATVKRISQKLEKNWVITELSDAKGKARFAKQNSKISNTLFPEDTNILVNSRYLQKKYYYMAHAENKTQAQELIEKNVPLIALV